MELFKELIVKIRNIKAEMGVQTKDIELIVVSPKRKIEAGAQFIKSLAKITNITVHKSLRAKPEQSATGVVHDVQFFIPLKGLVDIGKEVERLKKEDEKVDKELGHLEKLLSNKNFTEKADPAAVEKQKVRQKELAEKKKIISERIKDLA